MGKKSIKLRPLESEYWTAASQAIQRLKLYIRFLPIQHQRAKSQQAESDKGGIIPSLDVPSEFLKITGMRSMSVEEWVMHIESPFMEWEVYWESIYKSIYLINYISGFIPLVKARDHYKEHIDYLGELEEARHTFAHFAERLPSAENVVKQAGSFGYGYTDSAYQFGGSTWGTTSDDMNQFLSISNQFVVLAESELQSWSKANIPQPPTPIPSNDLVPISIPQFHWLVRLSASQANP